MLGRFLEQFSGFVIRCRGPVLIFIGLGFLLFAYQIRNIQADFSPRELHATYEELSADLEDFTDVFGDTENVILLLFQAEDVLSVEVLQYMHDMARHYAEQPYVERVDSLTMTSFALSEGPGAIRIGPVVAGDTVEPFEAEELAEAVAATPLVQGKLISRDNDLAAVALYLSGTITKAVDAMPIIDGITEYIDENPPPDGALVTAGGLPHIRVWVANHFKSDQILFIPLSLLVCFLILFVSFRWIPGVFFPGLAVIVSATLCVGAMAALGESINIINQVVPVVIIVIGISDSIHLVSRFLEEYANRPDAREASRRTLRFMAMACFLTSLTTAVGFGSLGVSRTEILVRFGMVAAIGVMLAYLVTVLLLPSLLSWTHPPERTTRVRSEAGWLEASLARLMRAIVRRPIVVLLLSALVFIATIAVAAQVNVDTRLLEIFRPGDEPYATTNLVQNELDGVLPLEISFESEIDGRMGEPDVLNAMNELGMWLRQQDGVLSTTGFSDYLHQARVAYQDDPTRREQPFSTTAEVGALTSLLEGGNPNPIEPWVTFDRRRARLNVKLSDIGAKSTQALAVEINDRIDTLFGELSNLTITVTGNAFVATAGIDALVQDLVNSLLLAFVIIFALMTLLFRSIRMGLIAIPPNVVPLVMTMAYMTVAGIDLNTTTVIAFAISLGLAVDHTIHMLARFNEEVAAGRSPSEAIVGAARGTGRAIVVTSFTLFAGMMVLLASSFVPVHQFATLLAVTALSCLLGNLIVLPALLKITWKPIAASEVD